MENFEIENWVSEFAESAGTQDELKEIIEKCITLESKSAVKLINSLFISDYSGFTYSYILKQISAMSLIYYKKRGIKRMIKSAQRKNKTKEIRMVSELISDIINNSVALDLYFDSSSFLYKELKKAIESISNKTYLPDYLRDLYSKYEMDVSFSKKVKATIKKLNS